jgi:tetratricopeptide (TPR) repeat protein
MASFPEAAAHYNQGLIFKDQGKLAEAAECWRRTIALEPGNTQALNNLGNVLREQGELDEAVTCYRRAIQLQPDLARLHYNLANALRDQGKLEEAVAAYRRAVALAPDYAEAHSNLGNVLRSLGRFDEAEACWRRTVELRPDVTEAHFNLSVAYTDRENFADAAACCRRALALKPDFAEAHNNLGNALRELGALDEATACCRRAVALNPTLAEAHNNLGNALKDRDEFDEAVACYRRAVALRPDHIKAHINMGAALVQLGDFRAAAESFRAALGHDRDSASAHFHLAELLGGELSDDELAAQQRLLAEGNLADWQRMLLKFGLAQVLDARGEYVAAAGHLVRANALQLGLWRKRGREYDPLEHQRLVTGLIELCTPEFFTRHRCWGADGDQPVFVVGLPRSGTTLVEQILAAHSQIFAAGEIKLVSATLTALTQPGGDLLAGIGGADQQLVRSIAELHLERLRALGGAALRIVDKLPENYLFLGPLAVLFPRARFIHCRRDLRDVAVSCWMTHFQDIRWANDHVHITEHFRQYLRLMEHWRKVLPTPLLEIDYEQTVNDLEGVARQLIDFCGLPWEPRCLDFHMAKRPVTTASSVQVRQPVYKTSVARWRNYEQPLASLFAQLADLPSSTTS